MTVEERNGHKRFRLLDFVREYAVERLRDVREDLSMGGGRAYVYVCRSEYSVKDVTSPAESAVRATYIDIVETGLTELGAAFRAGYEP
ncbi:MAG TPA: hypothetical protein VEX68_20740 [Bryobacteraceae bacterium]|nr:hypothetical protein [Bryobacteraceae bacterium]